MVSSYSPIGLLPLVVFSATLLASSGALFALAAVISLRSVLRARAVAVVAEKFMVAGVVALSILLLSNILEALR